MTWSMTTSYDVDGLGRRRTLAGRQSLYRDGKWPLTQSTYRFLYISCFILIKFINIRVTQCLPLQRLLLHFASRPALRARPSGGHVVRLLLDWPVTFHRPQRMHRRRATKHQESGVVLHSMSTCAHKQLNQN